MNVDFGNRKLRTFGLGKGAIAAAALAMALIAAGTGIASAKAVHHGTRAAAPPPYDLQTLLVDADNGRVLEASNADELHHPASLTKLMTLYLVFDALDSGKLKLTDQIPMSAHAASVEPTKLNVAPGHTFSVEDGILAIVTLSANDVATAFGEYLGGTEQNFATLMTAKAHQLGMAHTTFLNASGLPIAGQYSTPRDMVVLAEAIMHNHANYYPMFNTREFAFEGRTIHGHNYWMNDYPGADGLKTGFIGSSGFNLVASAKRDGHRLIGVVMGGPSTPARDHLMAQIFDAGYAELGVGAPLVASATPAPAPAAAAAPVPAAAAPAKAPVKVAAATVHHAPAKPVRVAAVAVAAHHRVLHPTLHVTNVSLEVPAAVWGVQLGAYGQQRRASQVAQEARRHLGAIAGASRISVVSIRVNKKVVWGARLTGLSRKQAEEACHKIAGRGDCAVIGSPERVASR